MEIAVTGSHGLIGTALVAHLVDRGHRVRRVVRSAPRGPQEVRWDPAAGLLDPHDLTGIDGVVNLAGAGLGDKRWTARYKQVILRSRVQSTDLIARAVAQLDRLPAAFVQASGIGAYGDRGEELLDERSTRGTDFLADVVHAWEGVAAPAQQAGVPVALARSGIVLSDRGGALARLLPMLRLGLIHRLGSGRQFWSWITLDDEVRAITYLLEHPRPGPVNLCAPRPARNADVIAALADALHRPALAPVPGWALRAAIGEFASDVLGSQRAVPAVLTTAGYDFAHPDLATAAAWLTRPHAPR